MLYSVTDMARVSIIFLVIINVDMFGRMMSSQLFYRLYLQQVDGLELDHGHTAHVDLKPPITNASCILLCGLTPGCLWVKLLGNGTCITSDNICPRMAENHEATLVGIASNKVKVFTIYPLEIVHCFLVFTLSVIIYLWVHGGSMWSTHTHLSCFSGVVTLPVLPSLFNSQGTHFCSAVLVGAHIHTRTILSETGTQGLLTQLGWPYRTLVHTPQMPLAGYSHGWLTDTITGN